LESQVHLAPPLHTSINLAWKLLDRYYSMTDMLPAMHPAIALHPDMKLNNFEEEWFEHPDWVALA
ncbi:hypothetical protein K440DRAFT_571165, partial [Wilcoxina mikolae CBS 423.85]